ncbi:MAG: glycosyltransferase family 2 protein [Faecalibacterium sp.]|nr:glycosyltransferase family 2 protein [Ruminococcus sp.]MCM1392333.1 glycosyltransferase family 2 protein [Ruminococcus sp.]MCM1486042.1 glycosyltransferase family 2 protein [Faecalibacterium sp.]
MISVALAAYKGEKYIEEQLRSILVQLGHDDEIVVSDDKPGGLTEKIVRRIMAEDDRVIYVDGKAKGVVANFTNAIRHCRGDKIFLCDQDDVWLPNKVKRVMEAFDNGATLVLHNAYVTDGDLNITEYSFFASRGSRKGFLRNIMKNSYMGCCMAFDRSLMKKIMPIPRFIPMHDQWIGLIGEVYGKVEFIDAPLIYYRVHGGNVTGGETTMKQKLKWRHYLIKKLSMRIFLHR